MAHVEVNSTEVTHIPNFPINGGELVICPGTFERH